MKDDLLGLAGVSESASKFAIKLIEVAQVGVGGIFAPWQLKRMARAEADAEQIKKLAAAETEVKADHVKTLALTQSEAEAANVKALAAVKTEVEAEQIRAYAKIAIDRLQLQAQHELETYRRELEAKALPTSSSDPDEPHVEWVLEDGTEIQRVPVDPLPQRALARLNFQEAKRQTNVEQVVSHAYNERVPDAAVSDEPVDPDIVARIFGTVQDVSNGDMQKLWGKLLAGEIARPGSFSLRTLDVLRNLSVEEARLFARFCGYRTKQSRILLPMESDFDLEARIMASGPRKLVECGLLREEGKSKLIDEESLYPNEIHLVYRKKTLTVFRGDYHTANMSLLAYSLTSVGRELAKLGPPDEDESYIRDMCERARKHHLEVEVTDTEPDPAAET